MNLFLKLIGYKHNYGGRDRSYKFSWGEINLLSKDICFKWTGPHYCYEPKLIIGLYFITFYFSTPAFGVKAAQSSKEERNYGFYLYSNLHDWSSTVFMFYSKSWHIYMPWTYTWESTELLDWDLNELSDGTDRIGNKRDFLEWHKFKTDWAEKNGLKFDYRYALKSGESQERVATITNITRMTWKMRGWPWKKKVNTSIDVTFNDEVGERTGSWKGGTIGCSYEMLPNETPEQTLRRMEKERKF